MTGHSRITRCSDGVASLSIEHEGTRWFALLTREALLTDVHVDEVPPQVPARIKERWDRIESLSEKIERGS
jgi:hypothetical protein